MAAAISPQRSVRYWRERSDWRFAGPRLGALWFAALSLAGCWPDAGESDPSNSTRRVLLVASDGAAWQVIDPLLSAGELPNLARLLSRGCRGKMRSLLPSLSPRIWTSVATGVPPEEHGIPGFARRSEGEKQLFNSRDVRVPTVWELASAASHSVGVTNWWFTYPITPVNGFIISDHTIPSRSHRVIGLFSGGDLPPPISSHLVYPEDLLGKLENVLAESPLAANVQWSSSLEDLDLMIEDILREDSQITKLAIKGRSIFSPRFEAVYFKGIDRASHRFWREYRPNHPAFARQAADPKRVQRYKDVIPDVYRHSDELLGELTADFGEDDVVIVVSDHGFEARISKNGNNTGSHGTSKRSVDGIYLISGGPISDENCPTEISLYDVAPTALYLLGMAVPRQMVGDVPKTLFRAEYLRANPVEWTDPVEKSMTRDEEAPPAEAIEAERIERLKALGYLDDST